MGYFKSMREQAIEMSSNTDLTKSYTRVSRDRRCAREMSDRATAQYPHETIQAWLTDFPNSRRALTHPVALRLQRGFSRATKIAKND